MIFAPPSPLEHEKGMLQSHSSLKRQSRKRTHYPKSNHRTLYLIPFIKEQNIFQHLLLTIAPPRKPPQHTNTSSQYCTPNKSHQSKRKNQLRLRAIPSTKSDVIGIQPRAHPRPQASPASRLTNRHSLAAQAWRAWTWFTTMS
jgi:hypothetical protein